MATDMWDSISRNFVKWMLGVIATAMITLAGAGIKFYVEWKADEAYEEAIQEADKSLMFDTPEQKQEVKSHVKDAVPSVDLKVKMERDEDFQKEVLRELKQMQKMDTLNADQIYIIKEEIKEIKGH